MVGECNNDPHIIPLCMYARMALEKQTSESGSRVSVINISDHVNRIGDSILYLCIIAFDHQFIAPSLAHTSLSVQCAYIVSRTDTLAAHTHVPRSISN